MITSRVVLVPVAAHGAPGLLGAAAWDAVRAADGVILTVPGPAGEQWWDALEQAHAEPLAIGPEPGEAALRGALAGMARVGQGAWLLEEPELARGIALARSALELADAPDQEPAVLAAPPTRVAAAPEPRGAEAPDAPDARTAALARAIAVMDALRSPGGDAWSAAQTHESLARYLLEETCEVLEVIEEMPPGPARDAALADELGDILFQVLFHARLGEESQPPWSLADVADGFTAKMERRNPHVFGGPMPGMAEAETSSETDRIDRIIAQWHAVKRAEGSDPGLFAHLPRGLPALQRAAKVVHRARSAGRLGELQEAVARMIATGAAGEEAAGESLRCGARLLESAIAAEARDIDPESALRMLLGRLRAQLEEHPDGRPDEPPEEHHPEHPSAG